MKTVRKHLFEQWTNNFQCEDDSSVTLFWEHEGRDEEEEEESQLIKGKLANKKYQ